MTAGELIRFLEEYDESQELEVEAWFMEAGDSRVLSSDVTTFSKAELDRGRRNEWPTITVDLSFGSMAYEDLDRLITCVKGIDERLRYNRGTE